MSLQRRRALDTVSRSEWFDMEGQFTQHFKIKGSNICCWNTVLQNKRNTNAFLYPTPNITTKMAAQDSPRLIDYKFLIVLISSTEKEFFDMQFSLPVRGFLSSYDDEFILKHLFNVLSPSNLGVVQKIIKAYRNLESYTEFKASCHSNAAFGRCWLFVKNSTRF